MANDFQLHRLEPTSHAQSRRRHSGRVRGVREAVQNTFHRFFGSRERTKRTLKRSVIAGFGAGLLYFLFIWFTLPDVSDPRSFLAAESTVITDRNGDEIYRLYAEEDRTFIPEELIPDTARQAIVAIEDERFYTRGCLDIRALLRVVFNFGQSGGASTLTRQLARNALDLQNENIVNRKVKELILGCQMESQHTKDEVLTLYLNWIPFGQNAYGIEQASQAYFGKSASGLTLAESAVLAALPQRPSYFSPYGSHVRTGVSEEIARQIAAGEIRDAGNVPEDSIVIGLLGNSIGTGANVVYIGGRTDQVLRNMQEQGFITDEERQAALDELSTITFQPSRESLLAPHFVLWVRQQVEELLSGEEAELEEGILERGGLIIETTLDLDIQAAAQDAVQSHSGDILDRFGVHNIAMIALDSSTREILAYVGNTDYSDEEFGGKIDMVQAPRQPGSSFKPFVYAAAFEKGYSPATVIYDVPTKIGDNEPQNYDGTFMGPITIRQALAASRNIPAAKAYFLAEGEDNILQLVASLGAPTPLEQRAQFAAERAGGFEYGWPLALGAGETPLIEMANAFGSLGDGGNYKPVVSIRRITDNNGNLLYEADIDPVGTPVLDPRIAYQVTSILSDETARPEGFWRTQLTVPGFQAAAKTGTSNKCLEWRDENNCALRKPDNGWVLGYTPEIVAGVWIGNADSSALFDRADGLTTASPIWKEFMIAAHRTIESPKTTFTVPEGLVQPQISRLSGDLVAECTPLTHRQSDIFLADKAPTEQDRGCALLMVDKVTGLLASDSCPEEAREEQAFLIPREAGADRWPTWQEGINRWTTEQMEIWSNPETKSGSKLPLPVAPTESCDPALTPGRLEEPTLTILFPSASAGASYPAFTPRIDYNVGSTVQEVRYILDGKRIAVETQAPFTRAIRVPTTVSKSGEHTLEVTLIDEYFNEAKAEVTFEFDEDIDAPSIRLLSPQAGSDYTTGDTLQIRAEADDASGGLKFVQFYMDETLLTTKPREPYTLQYPLNNTPIGTHIIRAVAEDLAGQTSEDEIVIEVTDSAASSAAAE